MKVFIINIYKHFRNGHAITIVGYNDNIGAWLVRNSWSNSWGTDGYAYFDYDYLNPNLFFESKDDKIHKYYYDNKDNKDYIIDNNLNCICDPFVFYFNTDKDIQKQIDSIIFKSEKEIIPLNLDFSGDKYDAFAKVLSNGTSLTISSDAIRKEYKTYRKNIMNKTDDNSKYLFDFINKKGFVTDNIYRLDNKYSDYFVIDEEGGPPLEYIENDSKFTYYAKLVLSEKLPVLVFIDDKPIFLVGYNETKWILSDKTEIPFDTFNSNGYFYNNAFKFSTNEVNILKELNKINTKIEYAKQRIKKEALIVDKKSFVHYDKDNFYYLDNNDLVSMSYNDFNIIYKPLMLKLKIKFLMRKLFSGVKLSK